MFWAHSSRLRGSILPQLPAELQLQTFLQLRLLKSKGLPVKRLMGTRLFVVRTKAVTASRELPGEPRGGQDSALLAALRHIRVNNRSGWSL